MNLLDKLFSEKYYEIRKFEQNGEIYEYLRIKIYKNMMMSIAKNRSDEIPFNNYFLKRYSIDGLKEFENKSRKSEKSHVIIATLMLLYTVRISIFIDSIWDSIFLLFFIVVNIVTNIYPIFLQRYNRIRIRKVLNRFELYNYEYGKSIKILN
jgi:hypothetical protein